MRHKLTILVSGSLAFDRIMDFPGRFSDHILPRKIHQLSVSFLVEKYSENFGGTAGNISYNLALLGNRPIVLGSAGKDFSPYRQWLTRRSVETRYVNLVKNTTTAVAHMITDKDNNQISGFHVGAGKTFAGVPPRSLLMKVAFACVSPAGHEDLARFPKIYKRAKIPYAFDPGQQITTLPKKDLVNGVTGAEIFFSNDYELALFLRKTGMTEPGLLKRTKVVITTIGPKGSIVKTGSKRIRIPPAKPKNTSDPTGAGDAYRAGFISGYVHGLPLDQCGRLGAVVSVYTVETYGTQTHRFTRNEVVSRYFENFRQKISL
ncbi:MAG: carbohydrate kinase family protein [Parcubacteria group bacterium]